MSWDSYLDNMVAQSNDAKGIPHCDKGAIISLDGGASWTSPNHPRGIQLTPAEAQEIAQMMKSGDFSSAQANGIVLEGVKYQFLREEDGKVAFAKKLHSGAITMQKSKSAVVIGHTREGSQQGNTNKAVGVIADYLESLGM